MPTERRGPGLHGTPSGRISSPPIRGHTTTKRVAVSSCGSPPRVRGAPLVMAARRPANRITPACTGSTLRDRLRGARQTDHPRVYGEHGRDVRQGGPLCGSPPRVRGALHEDDGHSSYPRITPACTGSTAQWSAEAEAAADHPRVYGEHGQRIRVIGYGIGALRDTSRGRVTPRITPACTGSTAERAAGPAVPTDHPRVYGSTAGIPPRWGR